MALSVVIMAGGSGERFWPYSRKDRPKQFLPIIGRESLFQAAVARARRLTDGAHICVVTGKRHRHLVAEQAPELPRTNILYEPEGRDTAPCVALAAAWIGASDPAGTMAVVPSDHMVTDEDAFVAGLQEAVRTAQSTGGLVTIGIPPTRPETGYGYIRTDAQVPEGEGRDIVRRVREFKEKPDAVTAARFLDSGEYLWNGGMFVWKVDAIREALSKHLPNLMEEMVPIESAIGTPAFEDVLETCFPGLPKVSIDYGVMERADKVWAVPAAFGWDDLGSWTALDRVLPADPADNRIDARALPVDTRRSILTSRAGSGRLLVTFGVEDALVVDTHDVVLVAPKSRAPELKKVLAELQGHGLGRYQEGEVSGPEAPGPDGICIRRSTAEDAEALMALDNKSWNPQTTPGVVHWDNVEAFHEEFPPGSLYVAEVDGEIAGCLRLHNPTPLRSNRHVGELEIAVDEPYRQKGVGSRLLQFAEDDGRGRGFHKLSLRVLATNFAAIAFYRANGYKEQGRLPREFFLDGAYVDDILMYKMLAEDPGTP